MRADRLLSILLLLQTHGRIPAGKLAKELEVSERTVYRDIDALSNAGIPVYGEPGPDGGYSLLDNYRTRLTGLTDKEIRALFMLGIPDPLMKLGVGQEIKTALLKLSAALPEEHVKTEQFIRQRFYLDSTWWQQGDEALPLLRIIHQAVLKDKKLRIKFRLPFPAEMEQIVEPYGLVAKAGVWYLVYSVHGSWRTSRVDSLLEATPYEEAFKRVPDFDLAGFWEEWRTRQEESLTSFSAVVLTTEEFLPVLKMHFGNAEPIEPSPEEYRGRIAVKLQFQSIEAARDRILGLGGIIEVLEPRALQRSVLDYAEQIVNLYS
jgi:predicted DNA-binding transcriptional regulator YafY